MGFALLGTSSIVYVPSIDAASCNDEFITFFRSLMGIVCVLRGPPSSLQTHATLVVLSAQHTLICPGDNLLGKDQAAQMPCKWLDNEDVKPFSFQNLLL